MFFISDFLERQSRPQASELEDWDEAKTKFKSRLYLRASTWKPFALYDIAPGEKIEFGNWVYDHAVFPKSGSLAIYQGRKKGTVFFDDSVVIPRVSRYEGGFTPRVWMSYTPMECLSQRAGLKMAKGKVLIGGLGMGWLANRVAAKKQVTEVVVVDRDADIIRLAAPCCLSPKTTVVRGDVWKEVDDYDDDWTFLFDVWPGYGSNKDKPEMLRFKQQRPRAKWWAWG